MRPVSKSLTVYTVLLSLGFCGACTQAQKGAESNPKEVAMAIELASPAFKEGEPIPSKYTCDGENVSPALTWKNLPQGTKSLALICDDPDAPVGTWVHWVIFNIPDSASGLPEGVPKDASLPSGATQGMSDFRTPGYGGPCPPSGRHRYFFKLYALDGMLHADPGTTKKDLLKAMEGHILSQSQLMGTYQRARSK
jgi:Raf kinase inhibitor-like YbhB/YbcL family protein